MFLVIISFVLVSCRAVDRPSQKKAKRYDQTGSSTADHTLVLQIDELRKESGTLRMNLFRQPAGFPDDHTQAYRTREVKLDGTSTTIRVSNLPADTYAVAVHHDENQDGKMNRNPIGIPTEGIATSGDPKVTPGPPSFEAARFQLQSPEQTVEMSMTYLLD